MIETLVTTEITETKTHPHGFDYCIRTVSDSTGRSDKFASIYDGYPMRESDDPDHVYFHNNKYYRFDGNDIVCIRENPSVPEMRKLLSDLVDRLVGINVHIAEVESYCACCRTDSSRTILFSEQRGFYDAGCGEAYSIIDKIVDISDETGKILGMKSTIADRYVDIIVQNYQSDLDSIDRWLNG